MKTALNEEGILVDNLYAIHHKDESYYCPYCKSKLLFKRGYILSPYFAHMPGSTCYSGNNGLSDWHKDWQSSFDIGNKEELIELVIHEDQIPLPYKNLFELEQLDNNICVLKRRADIVLGDYVIEIQHSTMSAVEFQARNWFYIESGYKIIWVFDLVDKFRYKQILKCNNDSLNNKYYWRHPFKTLEYLDLSDENVTVLFQFIDGSTERLISSSKDKITRRINLRWFYTDDFPDGVNEIIRYTKGTRLRNNPFLQN